MPTLTEIQAGVRRAVVLGEDSAVAPWLVGGRDGRKRLAIHHRHYHASLVSALLDRFPGTIWLVGTTFVAEAARRFVQNRPPTRPCIAEYGEDFPAFLAAERGAAELPYLRSFAELEWHLSRLSLAVTLPALSQADLSSLGRAARGESPAAFGQRCILEASVAPPSNTGGILGRRASSASADSAGVPRPSRIRARRLTRLARISVVTRLVKSALGATPDFHHGLLDPGTLADVRVTMQPGVHYFHAGWNVDTLIRLYLTDNAPDQFSLERGDAWIELRGARGDLRINRLAHPDFAFRSALSARQSLGDAAVSALDVDATFDAGHALTTMVTNGLVTAAEVHHPGGTE